LIWRGTSQQRGLLRRLWRKRWRSSKPTDKRHPFLEFKPPYFGVFEFSPNNDRLSRFRLRKRGA
jgi:hypothetical protein